MNRFALVVILIGIAVGSSHWLLEGRTETAKPTVESVPPSPEKKIIEKSFPPVFRDSNSEFECTIPIINDTGKPVQFTSVSRSCTCTEAVLEKYGLASGEETKLSLRVNLQGRTGQQRFSCYLADDAGRFWDCAATVHVCDSGSFASDSSLSFGAVEPGSILERTVEFDTHAKSEQELPNSIEVQLEGRTGTVRTRALRTESLAPAVFRRRFAIEMKLDPGTTAGAANVHLAVCTNIDNQRKEYRSLATWFVKSRFHVEPPMVFFGEVEAGKKGEPRTTTVARTDGQPLTVRGLKVEAPFLATMTESNMGKKITVKVEIDTVKLKQTTSREIELETDDPVQPVVRIPVAVVVKDAMR